MSKCSKLHYPKTLEEWFQQKLISRKDLSARVPLLKEKGTLVTLNGSFDLLHAGHLEMIYQASLQGDILLVALNSDSSIQAYKSPLRPIIPLEYRLKMMAALEFVDYVTYFEELNPIEVLSIIKPDVHVNGSEYGCECIEKEVVISNGGKLHIVQLVPGLSTSNIISKIIKTCV